MKQLKKTMMITSFALFTACSAFANASSVTLSTNTQAQTVDALLSKISNQLNNIKDGQVQTQNAIHNYSNFQLHTAYPSSPFPGWKDEMSNNIDLNPLNFGSFDQSNLTMHMVSNYTNKHPSKTKSKQAVYNFSQSMIPAINSEVDNVQTLKQQIAQYETILTEHLGQMNATQIARLRIKIDLLNTKINTLKYSQNIKTQKLLTMVMLNTSAHTGVAQ